MSLPLFTPGYRWRTLAHERGRPIEQRNRGQFDELVIDQWFHLEQMDRDRYWMQVAGVHLGVRLRRSGEVDITAWDNERTSRVFPEIQIVKRLPDGLPWWGKR